MAIFVAEVISTSRQQLFQVAGVGSPGVARRSGIAALDVLFVGDTLHGRISYKSIIHRQTTIGRLRHLAAASGFCASLLYCCIIGI